MDAPLEGGAGKIKLLAKAKRGRLSATRTSRGLPQRGNLTGEQNTNIQKSQVAMDQIPPDARCAAVDK
jgi:hypothetical protein